MSKIEDGKWFENLLSPNPEWRSNRNTPIVRVTRIDNEGNTYESKLALVSPISQDLIQRDRLSATLYYEENEDGVGVTQDLFQESLEKGGWMASKVTGYVIEHVGYVGDDKFEDIKWTS